MKPTIRHTLGTPDAYRIRDNGRRGEPLPGCDCMRCFGMCLVDPDIAHREIALRMEGSAETDHSGDST